MVPELELAVVGDDRPARHAGNARGRGTVLPQVPTDMPAVPASTCAAMRLPITGTTRKRGTAGG
jgi:hypothetical protein